MFSLQPAGAPIAELANVLSTALHEEFRRLAGVEVEVQKLTSTLASIQSALVDAERRQLDQATAQLWLDELKSVAYDADDVLDEWSYNILKSNHATRTVWPFNLLSACYCFPRIVSRRHFAVKVSNLIARLDALAVEKEKYSRSLENDHEQLERDITTSDIDISEVKGRDSEKEKLVNLLLDNGSELPKLRPISIVGMIGIGKTTLAKLVYNDERVECHFNIRIWVYVFQPFDKIRIAKAILESLTGHTPNLVELQSIASEIRRHIKGKMFLLVLDNVWNQELREWKVLESCLAGGSRGSKILVTTRNEKVAKLMGCNNLDIFRLGLLSNEECWSLFCEIAFDTRSREEKQNLETSGLKIVAKCNGLPLAVKIMADLLRLKETKLEWTNVEGELGMLEEVQKNIFGPLWLSYYDLSPASLKQCFLHSVVFPKGNRLSKDELISLWMAHGFLKPTKDRTVEMVGHDNYNELGMRSLFRDFEVEEKFNKLDKTYCKMHDMVHEFAEYIRGKECLYVDSNSAEEVASLVDVARNDSIYHLHVTLGENVGFHDSFYNLRKLRSLVVVPSKNGSLIGAALPRIFNQLTCLRSVSLNRCHIEKIPSNINKLVHLRWLKLSKNHALKELPETICELYNLQTLSVNWCHGMMRFPKGVDKLINLNHLKNDYTYFLLPKGVGKLSCLTKLLKVTVDPKFKDAFSLRELENLNKISGPLTIFFKERERYTLVEDAKQARLKEKKHITTLSLSFPERAREEWVKKEDEELVEALKPSPSLEMLRITCYMGANCPSWFSTLTFLKKLKLWYWSNSEHFPALAKLPCLEHIEFSSFERVKEVTAEFYKMGDFMGPSSSTAPLFPKLKSLEIMNMSEWEAWNNYDGDEEVMPCLNYLSIENCPKLKALPNFIRKKAALQKHIS